MVSKYNTRLKPLLLQALSKPEFYADLVYKFRKIVERPETSDHLSKIVKCYKWKGYNIDVVKQSALLGVNPVMVTSNCMPVGWGSDYDGPNFEAIH